MTKHLLSCALITLVAFPAYAQNNGLPNQRQSVVLVELIADRGLQCGLLRPWQAASLRMQTRDQLARFDEAGRAAVAADIEARRPAMGCDDATLTMWIEGAVPNFEREYLPELLAGYKAFALQKEPPAPFQNATKRSDYAEAVRLIDAKLKALEAAGVKPPGGMTWAALAQRQTGLAAQITSAISGTGASSRFSTAQATQLAEDIGRIGELWLADEGLDRSALVRPW